MAKNDEVLMGYDKPFAENPLFLDAMANCNDAKDNFKPIRIENKAKIKQAEDIIKGGKK